jgi:hypothetical protein
MSRLALSCNSIRIQSKGVENKGGRRCGNTSGPDMCFLAPGHLLAGGFSVDRGVSSSRLLLAGSWPVRECGRRPAVRVRRRPLCPWGCPPGPRRAGRSAAPNLGPILGRKGARIPWRAQRIGGFAVVAAAAAEPSVRRGRERHAPRPCPCPVAGDAGEPHEVRVGLADREPSAALPREVAWADEHGRAAVEGSMEDVPEQARLCPRCQQPMASGTLRTRIESGFGHWFAVAGSNRVRWTGEDGPYRVTAYRCPSCGAVELTATERAKIPGCLSLVLLLVGLVVGFIAAAGQLLAN